MALDMIQIIYIENNLFRNNDARYYEVYLAAEIKTNEDKPQSPSGAVFVGLPKAEICALVVLFEEQHRSES